MEEIWAALRENQAATADRRISALLEEEGRMGAFSVRHGDLLFDFAKTNIDSDALALLLQLGDAAGLADKREAMFTGARINETEDRAVLHTALRNLDTDVMVDGEAVMPPVRETYARMQDFCNAVRSGEIAGQGGTYTDVINIGIGGSDLGPAMAAIALSPYADGPRCHFVSNVDGAHLADTVRGLDPATTLVIVASKTFTTIETMTNAAAARDWMGKTVANPGEQFAAVSTAADKTAAFGIDPSRVFGFEDWVGGRYSVWGPIGLSLMLGIGPQDFAQFLAGGADMDAHFRSAPPETNLPMLLASTGLWHNQVCGYATRAVLPYLQRLSRLPAYLQQLEMESNGKRVSMDGADLVENSGPVVWGEPGTNGQHAFYQLIHQGTRVIPCEFIVAKEGHEPELANQHLLLNANCLAQSEALMRGRSLAEATEIMAKKGRRGTSATARPGTACFRAIAHPPRSPSKSSRPSPWARSWRSTSIGCSARG